MSIKKIFELYDEIDSLKALLEEKQKELRKLAEQQLNKSKTEKVLLEYDSKKISIQRVSYEHVSYDLESLKGSPLLESLKRVKQIETIRIQEVK
jgi:tRNA G18 (ribose-2'-O)-methylase SpoU